MLIPKYPHSETIASLSKQLETSKEGLTDRQVKINRVTTLPLPLYPVQILWINLVSDSALDKTFPFLREDEDVMSKPPTKLHEQFLDKVQILRVVYAALVISLGALFLYVYMIARDGDLNTLYGVCGGDMDEWTSVTQRA